MYCVREWTEEKKKSLLDFILSRSNEYKFWQDTDVVDVTIMGSYAYGNATEKSDIDAVIWVRTKRDLSGKFVIANPMAGDTFDGVQVEIRVRSQKDYEDGKFGIKKPNTDIWWDLPLYSLSTGLYHEGALEDLKDFYKFRRKNYKIG